MMSRFATPSPMSLAAPARALLAAAASIFLSSAQAAPAAHEAAKTAFERKMGVVTQSVKPTPVPGLFEVVVDRKVMYADKNANFLVQGDIIDLSKNVNLTLEIG